MNDQSLSVLRWALTLLGGYLAQRGLISNNDLSAVTSTILASIGPIMAVGMALWGWYSHSHAAKITAVNDIPGLKVVSVMSPSATVTEPPKVAT